MNQWWLKSSKASEEQSKQGERNTLIRRWKATLSLSRKRNSPSLLRSGGTKSLRVSSCSMSEEAAAAAAGSCWGFIVPRSLPTRHGAARRKRKIEREKREHKRGERLHPRSVPGKLCAAQLGCCSRLVRCAAPRHLRRPHSLSLRENGRRAQVHAP